jgi:ATP-dependent Lhr-like helicase
VIGRWSLSAPLFEGAPSAGPRIRALAELMLERHGIVTRETAIAEGIPGGFASIYAELQNLELLGTARRGYFVEGLGGAQFALPGAVERLRSLPQTEGSLQVLAATDPANPYGATLSWPKLEGQRRPARTAGAYVMLRDGEPLIYVERGGKGILRLQKLEEDQLADALAELAAAAQGGQIEKLAIERLDGEPVIGSGMESALIEAGFRRQPRRLVA